MLKIKQRFRYLKVNALECLNCGTYLISLHRHDFRACKCGTMVDGGFDYCRRGGKHEDMRELNLYLRVEDKGEAANVSFA